MVDDRDQTSRLPAARPVIQLPSIREIQAAQRPAAQANLFQRPPTAGNPQRADTAFQSNPSQLLHRTEREKAGHPQSATVSDNHMRRPPSTGLSIRSSIALPHASNACPESRASTSSAPPLPMQAVQQGGHGYDALPNAILVSRKQEGNPLLKHMRNARWQFADIVPDYIMGANSCALFLSLRFHLLKPEYIHHRIRELQRSFRLRVLVCHVDVDDVVEPLAQVTRAALLNNLTLICAWSPEECARYLETYKIYETKPADAILGRTEEDYLSRLNAAFTTLRGVNKTDVLTLGATFKTAANIMTASMEELSSCPGIGPTKVKRLFETFHEPFRKTLQPQPVLAQVTTGGPSSQEQPEQQLKGQSTEGQQKEPVTVQLLPMEDALLGSDEDGDDQYMQ